ncbi:MFS transporter [Actinomadura litoris]|uniref:MFS transporter n=1 Tax=Actinomadura litoris TaxID=2678616 RepID=A0A7K1KZ70_9ACTN|nr:MFS transporter [Actinomadura litoris]MUN37504.1 MFS transporter [Actinomadura litoris]
MPGALWRDRELRLLTVGLTTGMAGDSVMLLTFAVWVKSLTGSTASAAMVMPCLAGPSALAPLGGWLLDRVSKRRFLVHANLVAAVVLLPLLAVRDRSDVWIIYVVAALYGTLFVATAAALNGLLKELLDDDMLVAVNGTLQGIKEGLRVAGPLTGAALFAVLGGAAVALVDAVTFLVAAGSIAAIRPPRFEVRRGGPSWRGELSAGVRHLVDDPALRRTMTASAIAWLVLGLGESVSFAIVERGLHRPPEFLGVLACAQGVGSVAGGLASARAVRRVGEMGALAVGLCAFGAGTALCAVAALPAVLAGRVVAGAGFAVGMVAFVTLLQRRTPASLLGRVSTAAETFTSGPQTISIMIGAALIATVDHRLLLGVMAVGMVGAGLHLWPHRHLAARAPAHVDRSPTMIDIRHRDGNDLV